MAECLAAGDDVNMQALKGILIGWPRFPRCVLTLCDWKNGTEKPWKMISPLMAD